jgi:hypothetical protein
MEKPIPEPFYKQLFKNSYKYEKYGYTYAEEEENEEESPF